MKNFFEKVRAYFKAHTWMGLFAILVFMVLGSNACVSIYYGAAAHEYPILALGIAGLILAFCYAIKTINDIHEV